jgi:hypothetical protein
MLSLRQGQINIEEEPEQVVLLMMMMTMPINYHPKLVEKRGDTGVKELITS